MSKHKPKKKQRGEPCPEDDCDGRAMVYMKAENVLSTGKAYSCPECQNVWKEEGK